MAMFAAREQETRRNGTDWLNGRHVEEQLERCNSRCMTLLKLRSPKILDWESTREVSLQWKTEALPLESR